MTILTARHALRFAGERVERADECNPWPQPSVISRLLPQRAMLMDINAYLDFKHSAIACVAYHRWQAQGSPDGRANENWLAAEAELMPHMAVEDGPVVIP